MQKIITNLWFDHQAEEAARYYTSLFDDSRIVDIAYYNEAGPGPAGTAVTVIFELAGQRFVGINGGPAFTFTEAMSLEVVCEDQDEVDRLWDKLVGDGGQESQCGWLKDKYGLSWQIIPKILTELITDPDPRKAARVTEAMLGMRKIDISQLREAYASV